MTSEEKLVAQAAKELLEASPAIDLLGQIVLGTEQEELKLPCTVVSARFVSEQPASSMPKEYELTVEVRSIPRVHDEEAVDETLRAVGVALDTMPTPTPPTLVNSFAYYRIENATGSTHEAGDTNVRSRTYRIFAGLL